MTPRLTALFLVLLAGCAAPQPVPPMPKASPLVVPASAGSGESTLKGGQQAAVIPAPEWYADFEMRYPEPRGWVSKWVIEASDNLQQWHYVRDVTNSFMVVSRTNGHYFRIHGIP